MQEYTGYKPVREVAKRVGLHVSTLYRWIKAEKVDVWRPHQRMMMVDPLQVERVARADWRSWRACKNPLKDYMALLGKGNKS